MKRNKLLSAITAVVLLLSTPLTVFAGTISGGSSNTGSSGNTGTGSGTGAVSQSSNDIVIYDASGNKWGFLSQNEVTTYYPKIAILQNINYLASVDTSVDANGQRESDPVYWIPKTSDLDFDLTSYIANNGATTSDNSSYAYVYDGEYNSQAELRSYSYITGDNNSSVTDTQSLITTSSLAYPAFKELGYDLMLAEDKYTLSKDSSEDLHYTHDTVVASDALTTEVAAMDIYKAIGGYEYQLTVASTKFKDDSYFNANSSPILSMINVATSNSGSSWNKGLDVSEANVGVAISRTIPSLYWTRLQNDGILSEQIKDYTSDGYSVSTLTRVGTITPSNGNLTYSEFCKLLICILNLYGESPLDASTLDKARVVYANELANISGLPKTDQSIIEYLLAKGILSPEQVRTIDFSEPVYLLPETATNNGLVGNHIIDVLYRVSNVDARYTMPEVSSSIPTSLVNAGYGSANVTICSDISNLTITETSSLTEVVDYLIPVTDANTTKLKYSSVSNLGTEVVDATTDMCFYKVPDSLTSIGADGIQYDTWTSYLSENEISGVDLATGYIGDTSSIRRIKSASSSKFWENPATKNYTYYYYGVEYYNDPEDNASLKPYYHFKLSKDFATQVMNGNIVIGADLSSVLNSSYVLGIDGNYHCSYINNSTGGILQYDGNTLNSALSFDECNFDNTFTDTYRANAHSSRQAAGTTLYTLTFYVRCTAGNEDTTTNHSNTDTLTGYLYTSTHGSDGASGDYETSGFNWYNIVTQSGGQQAVQFTDGMASAVVTNEGVSPVTLTIFEGDNSQGAASANWYRVEVQTKDVTAIKNSLLITGCRNQINMNVKAQEGFYRSSNDGSLLVSYNYLKQLGLVTYIQEVSDDMYVLTAGKYATNITICNKDSSKYIMVGDTLYANLDEELVETVNGDTYINYRACLGWASSFAMIPDDSDGGTIVVPMQEFTSSINNNISQSTVSVATFFPSSNTKTLYTSVDYSYKNSSGIQDESFEGICLAGSYALAPYVIVMDGTNNLDYAFIWHRKSVLSYDGSTTFDQSDPADGRDDASARQKFQDLTGMKLSDQSDYLLTYYPLDRTIKDPNSQHGLVYAGVQIQSKDGQHNVTTGYLYTPIEYGSVNSTDITNALDDYARSVDGKASETDPILPIVNYKASANSNNRYVDVNVNICSSDGSTLVALGHMPYYIGSSNASNDKTYTVLNGNCSTSNVETDDDSSTKDYEILTAPVGIFAQLRSLGSLPANQITGGSLYFGTSRCSIKNNTVTIYNRQTSLDVKETAYCTYLSNGTASVYVVSANSSSIGDFLQNLDNKLEFAMDDPSSLVDWGQYKFDRLVKNLDAWSTVVLIFILNILPRVCLLLTFVLMILSLIVNVKPWRMFCERVFDVYSFLTFGHMTVGTIDTKRMFIISLVCSILFIIIMDGQLFNLITFLAKTFIAWYQK